MLKKYITGLLVGIALILPIAVCAQDTPPGKWWHLPRISKEINLNKGEMDKLDNLYLENRRKLIDLKSNLEKERFELENLLEQEPLNEALVLSQYRKLEAERAKLSTERFQYLLEVRKIIGLDRYQRLILIFNELRKKRAGEGMESFKDNE